ATLKALTVSAPSGERIPLTQLAEFVKTEGLGQILREGNQRRIGIKWGVRERDMGGLVAEAVRRVAAAGQLPEGYRMVWSGRFEDQQRALARLYVIVPLVIFIIFILLFGAFQSIGDALLIMLNLPFALIGGTLALFLWRTTFNISAAVGFVAVFGVSVLNGVVLVSSIRQARAEGLGARDAVLRGCALRFRPIVVSGIVAVIGFIPAAISHGIGSEIQRPLARVGHEVVVATRPSEHWARCCRQEGLAHHGVPMTSEVDVASAWRLARILRAHRIDVVHAHKGKGRTLALMAGLFVRIPVLILNRGVSFPLDRFQRLGYTTRRVTAIIAVCESIKRALVRSGVDGKKVEVIYSGTDTARFHPGIDGGPVRRELGFTPDDFVITQIGVRSWKGNDDVIDAMVWLAAAAPQARLLIVGARNPDSLCERVRHRRLNGRVRVIGYREDIPEILAASDCCGDASYARLGLTGTLREALAVAVPVVATDL